MKMKMKMKPRKHIGPHIQDRFILSAIAGARGFAAEGGAPEKYI